MMQMHYLLGGARPGKAPLLTARKRSEQPMVRGVHHRFEPAVDPEFAHQILDVVPGRGAGHDKLFGDGADGRAAGQQPEDLQFPRRHLGRQRGRLSGLARSGNGRGRVAGEHMAFTASRRDLPEDVRGHGPLIFGGAKGNDAHVDPEPRAGRWPGEDVIVLHRLVAPHTGDGVAVLPAEAAALEVCARDHLVALPPEDGAGWLACDPFGSRVPENDALVWRDEVDAVRCVSKEQRQVVKWQGSLIVTRLSHVHRVSIA